MHPFQVMAEPIRRRIIEILASGEHPSGMVTADIETQFGVTRAAAARHLRILLDEGWVERRPDLTQRLYRLHPTAIDALEAELAWLQHLWERRIGDAFNRPTDPRHAEPYARDTTPHPRHPRPTIGQRKGHRGKSRRNDPWGNSPPRPDPAT